MDTNPWWTIRHFCLRASIRRLIGSTDSIQKEAKPCHEDHNSFFISTPGIIAGLSGDINDLFLTHLFWAGPMCSEPIQGALLLKIGAQNLRHDSRAAWAIAT